MAWLNWVEAIFFGGAIKFIYFTHDAQNHFKSMRKSNFSNKLYSFIRRVTGKNNQVQVFLFVCWTFFAMLLKFHYHNSKQSLN